MKVLQTLSSSAKANAAQAGRSGADAGLLSQRCGAGMTLSRFFVSAGHALLCGADGAGGGGGPAEDGALRGHHQ